MSPSHPHEDDIIAFYEANAAAFDADRNKSLFERAWLARFIALLPADAAVLDVGCGSGEPLAAHLLAHDVSVTGIDSAPSLIALCRARFPEAGWIVGDMREMELGRRFDGILAWDSFFHLAREAQRAMIPRFAAHAQPGCTLMFNSGPQDGVAMGCYRGRPLHHASLAPDEYRLLLAKAGFAVLDHRVEDPDCGSRTIWLARFEGLGPSVPS